MLNTHPKKWLKEQAKELYNTKQLKELYDEIDNSWYSKRRKKYFKNRLLEAYQKNTVKDQIEFERDFKQPRQKRSRALSKTAAKQLTPSEQKIKKYVFHLNDRDEKRMSYYNLKDSDIKH